MSYTGSQGQVGRSTVVSIGAAVGSSGSFVPIGEITESPLSGAKWDTPEFSNFQSGVDKEFRKSMRDNGTVTLSMNRIGGGADPGQVALMAAYDDPNGAYQFEITYPPKANQSTGDVDAFTALVISVDQTQSLNDPINLKVGLKKTGPTTTTSGTLISQGS